MALLAGAVTCMACMACVGRVTGPREVVELIERDAPRATVSYEVRKISKGPIGIRTVSGVWTGTEYLLLGGEQPDDPGPPGSLLPGGDERWAESSDGMAWTTPGFGYDPARDRWRKLPGRPIPGTFGDDPVAWHDGRVFVLDRRGQGSRYDPRTAKLQRSSTEGAPEHCRGQTMRVHDRYAMIWGCSTCMAHVYDRRADSWTAFDLRGGSFEYASCEMSSEGLVGERFVVVLRKSGGAYWDIGADDWQPITAVAAPQRVSAGPVGDADAAYVVDETAGDAWVYRYEFMTDSWSREPLDGRACQARQSVLRHTVLLHADNYGHGGPYLCSYDLANAAQLETLPERPNIHGNVAIFGDDQLFVWAHTDWHYFEGEAREMPTVAIHNHGWVIDIRVERPAGP